MLCSFCGADQENNKINCHYCGYVFDSTPFQFEKENFIKYKVEETKEVEHIFEKWIKKNKFVENDVATMSNIKKINKYYLPIHLIKGDGEISFFYTILKKDPKSEKMIQSKKRERSVSFQAKEKIITASAYIKRKHLNDLHPFHFFDFEKKRDKIDVLTIGINKKNAIKKAKEEEIERQTVLFSKILKGSTYNIIDRQATFNLHSNKFFYAPIIEANYEYKNKEYKFYINAYNEKTSGEFPAATTKILLLIMFLSIFSGIIGYLIWVFFS